MCLSIRQTAAVRRQIPSFELEAGAACRQSLPGTIENAVQGERVVYPDGVFADLAGFYR